MHIKKINKSKFIYCFGNLCLDSTLNQPLDDKNSLNYINF
jgi:hypothetical protein